MDTRRICGHDWAKWLCRDKLSGAESCLSPCVSRGCWPLILCRERNEDGMKAELIAPCGMNCSLCYGYIRPKNKSLGCRAPEASKPKSCTNCKIVQCEKRIQNGWETCAPCDTPCKRLKDLDKRYRSKYHMSMQENLALIREHGVESFLRQQEETYRCLDCGATACVHREECPECKAPVWERN